MPKVKANLSALIVPITQIIAGFVEWMRKKDVRMMKSCLRSAKMMVYWLDQLDLPQKERRKAKDDEYCMNKVDHYANQFKVREDRLTN